METIKLPVRITKDNYYMLIAETCSKRSLDPNSKFGCIAVSEEGSILSTGYNGPPRNVDDSLVPLSRPEKYTFFEHSERNCIYNAARIGVPLKGCTFYVTGVPCIDCLRAMYQVGAIRIVMKKRKAKGYPDNPLLDFLSSYIRLEYYE